MDSIPPATTISDSPSCTACAARATAFSPEPQTLLMVMAATRASQPPFSAACRAGFCPSPAWTTLPRTASSICLASRPARRMASATALPPSSGAENPARPPWNFPMGVRTAERMTGVSVVMAGLQRNSRHHYSAKEERRLGRHRRGQQGRSMLRPHFTKLGLVCGGSNCARLGFVRAGAIKPGHGNAEQAVVHRQLRAMMNMVVHHHAPNACHAWHVENFLAAGEQFPILHYFRVAYGRKRCARFHDILVKHREQFLSIVDLRWLKTRPIHRGIIQLLGLDCPWQPFHHRRYMAGEPADGAGLVVRFPIPLFVGTSLQDFAGVLHFLVKLTKHHLSNGHDFLPCGILRLRRTDPRRTKSELSRSSFHGSETPRLRAAFRYLLSCRSVQIGDLAFAEAVATWLDSPRKRKKITTCHTNSAPLT